MTVSVLDSELGGGAEIMVMSLIRIVLQAVTLFEQVSLCLWI